MTEPTTPDDEPGGPIPTPPGGTAGPDDGQAPAGLTPPPLDPPSPPPPAPEQRYDTSTVVWTAVITTVLAAVLSVALVVVPILLIVAGVLTARATDVRSRSIWMGILIGCGIGLLVFAGICVALLNSSGA